MKSMKINFGMKSIAKCLFVLFMVGLTSCSNSHQTNDQISKEETFEHSEPLLTSSNDQEQVADTKLQLEIVGMSCEKACAGFIHDKLAEKDGITNCKVNFGEEKATIFYNSEETSAIEIVETINKLADGKYEASILSEEGNS